MATLSEICTDIYQRSIGLAARIPENIAEQYTCKDKAQLTALKLTVFSFQYSMFPVFLAMADLISPSTAAVTAATLPITQAAIFLMNSLEELSRHCAGNTDQINSFNPADYQSTSLACISFETIAPLCAMMICIKALDHKDPFTDHLAQLAMLIQTAGQCFLSVLTHACGSQIYPTEYKRISLFNCGKTKGPLIKGDDLHSVIIDQNKM